MEKLLTAFEEAKNNLKAKAVNGGWVIWGENGPVSIGIIAALVEQAQSQAKRIDDLEAHLKLQ